MSLRPYWGLALLDGYEGMEGSACTKTIGYNSSSKQTATLPHLPEAIRV